MGYGRGHQSLYEHLPRNRIAHHQKAWLQALVVQGGIMLAVLGWRELQELQVKAPRPCLGKLEGLSDWTLQQSEAQEGTPIICFCRKRL